MLEEVSGILNPITCKPPALLVTLTRSHQSLIELMEDTKLRRKLIVVSSRIIGWEGGRFVMLHSSDDSFSDSVMR